MYRQLTKKLPLFLEGLSQGLEGNARLHDVGLLKNSGTDDGSFPAIV